MRIGLLIAVIIIILVFAPLFVIWSLNTLFTLEIPIAFNTWVATVILCGVINGSSVDLS